MSDIFNDILVWFLVTTFHLLLNTSNVVFWEMICREKYFKCIPACDRGISLLNIEFVPISGILFKGSTESVDSIGVCPTFESGLLFKLIQPFNTFTTNFAGVAIEFEITYLTRENITDFAPNVSD